MREMSEDKTSCNGQCGSCSSSGTCEDSTVGKLEKEGINEIKHVIAVMSGKGGVGKSSISSLLASALKKQGHAVGILDADITGPSIPKMFGLRQKAQGTELGIIPVSSDNGIEIMSLNLLLENEDDPVVWRGPMIAGAIKQFYSEVIWNKLDYLVVDLPPGTGDSPLTVLQSLPVSGIVVVSSPQDLVGMVVKKAIKMAEMLNTKVFGLVENMSYIKCPHCEEKIEVFGKGHGEEVAAEMNISFLGQLPMDAELAKMCDAGKVEDYECPVMSDVADMVNKVLNLESQVKKTY